MRYWSNDDISWVQSSYVERPSKAINEEGDNPIAYHVTYGFKKGGTGTLILTKPAGVFYMERYDYILTAKSMIKFEDNLIAYGVEEDNYSIEKGRKHFQTKDVYKENETSKILAKGPHKDAMGQHNTKLISENFVRSIILNKPELRKNSFKSSINSLSAVLAANVSSSIGGQKIDIDEFESSAKFSQFRAKPKQ